MAKIDDIAKNNLEAANNIAQEQQQQLDGLGLTDLTVEVIAITYAVRIVNARGDEVDPEDLGQTS